MDPTELARFLEEAEAQTVPQSPAAIDRLLTDLEDAGLVTPETRPASTSTGRELYRCYILTDAGLARAHELEAADKRFPPHGDDT